MKWSWKLGEFAGIGVYVHATFLLLIAWVAIGYWTAAKSMAASIWGVLFTLALFVCVVLHEYGHALTARRYGIKTRDITLLPIGGLARLERMPENPRQELWVALAGPAVNVVIAVVLWLWMRLNGESIDWHHLSLQGGSFLEQLLLVNLFLVAFNLLPAFPMDGGRVLRALLAGRMEYTRATQIAAQIGQGMAFLFGLLGFLGNPMLFFIALFVWIGAAQEAALVQMKSSLAGIPVSQAMMTDFRTLPAHETLQYAVASILGGSQTDFPVTDGERLLGVLTRAQLLKVLVDRGQNTPISEVMERDFQVAEVSDMLEPAIRRLQEHACHTVPVLQRGRLVGLLTMENLGEFLMVQAAVRGSKADTAPVPGILAMPRLRDL